MPITLARVALLFFSFGPDPISPTRFVLTWFFPPPHDFPSSQSVSVTLHHHSGSANLGTLRLLPDIGPQHSACSGLLNEPGQDVGPGRSTRSIPRLAAPRLPLDPVITAAGPLLSHELVSEGLSNLTLLSLRGGYGPDYIHELANQPDPFDQYPHPSRTTVIAVPGYITHNPRQTDHLKPSPGPPVFLRDPFALSRHSSSTRPRRASL